MNNLKELYLDILTNGASRQTRTGETFSVWDRKLEFDLREGFPAVTSKKLQWNAVVGELLWFLSGSSCIEDLIQYTYGSKDDLNKWTIWSDDTEKWEVRKGYHPDGFVGNLYPTQWRGVTKSCERDYNDPYYKPDQITTLVNKLINSPEERDLIVMAWNAKDIDLDTMALKPCHLGFQCYVEGGELSLKWWQRSVDSFLGLPFNIASYALLTHLLANWTGLKVGKLSCDLGDTHIYMNHFDAVNKYLNNPVQYKPELILPAGTETLESTLKLTALDFRNSLINYNHCGSIPAQLSTGV